MSGKMGPGTLRGEWRDHRNDGLCDPQRERRDEYRRMGQGLPGGLMVKALCIHCRGGTGSIPGQGTKTAC